MSTLLIPVPSDTPDDTLPPIVPDFGRDDLTHFYHPLTFPDNGTSWSDACFGDGEIPLPVSGDTSATQELEAATWPTVRLTTAASLFPGTVFPTADLGTVCVIAKVSTGDDKAGSAGYLLHNGSSGIAQNTLNSATITLTNGASGATASLNEWHLFTITTPRAPATRTTRFTVDGNAFTASSAAALDPRTIRIGSNTAGNHKAMTVAAAFAFAESIAAATITGTLYPAVKAAYPELDWA